MMSLNHVISWLFEGIPAGYQPQMGFADCAKSALLWVPGNKEQGPAKLSRVLSLPFLQYIGATNRAYLDPWAPQHDQPCVIAWAGLDIDSEDNPDIKPLDLIARVSEALPQSSIRLSCGGTGLHVFHRLSKPHGPIPTIMATPLTRGINFPFVQLLQAGGIHVCKSDSRMFYLCGGANKWVIQRPDRINPDIPELLKQTGARMEEDTKRAIVAKIPEGMAEWIQAFVSAGISVRPGQQNQVNIGRVIDVLRAAGETVNTRSPLTTRNGVNGFLDCSNTHLSLWSFADSAAIWIYQETDIIDSFLGGHA